MYGYNRNSPTRLRSSMVEQATHNRQATGSNPVGARLFTARLLIAGLVANIVCAPAPAQTTGDPGEPQLKPPISTPAPGQGSSDAGGTGGTSPPGGGGTSHISVPGSGPGGSARVPAKEAGGAAPTGTGSGNAAEAIPVYDGTNPAYPYIPKMDLLSPPAVPPKTLPPSYYEEGKQNSPLKQQPGVTQILGPRLQPTEPLKGSIVKEGLTATAGQLVGPMPSGRKLNVTVIVLKVKNNTTAPMTVDANSAIIYSGNTPIQALPENVVVQRTHPFFTGGQKVELAAITVATLGLATVIAGERMTNKTSPSARYGVYETMRRVEDLRFGKRLVLPGEESKGLVFFDQSVAAQGNVSIPLRNYPSDVESGRISVDVSGSVTLQP